MGFSDQSPWTKSCFALSQSGRAAWISSVICEDLVAFSLFLVGEGGSPARQFALGAGTTGFVPQGTAVMVQLLYSPWLAHIILGSFAVSIVASL